MKSLTMETLDMTIAKLERAYEKATPILGGTVPGLTPLSVLENLAYRGLYFNSDMNLPHDIFAHNWEIFLDGKPYTEYDVFEVYTSGDGGSGWAVCYTWSGDSFGAPFVVSGNWRLLKTPAPDGKQGDSPSDIAHKAQYRAREPRTGVDINDPVTTLGKLAAEGKYWDLTLSLPCDVRSCGKDIYFENEQLPAGSSWFLKSAYTPGDDTGWAVVVKSGEPDRLVPGNWEIRREPDD